jgi:site-specific DNA recombinase
MLLSFAQFEREVTAERIRDKIAASKAKGMWMGGPPPLGYRPDGRSLAIVEEHAAIVREIFRRYLELGNVRRLAEQLAGEGIRTPRRQRQSGAAFGDVAFTRGQLYALLKNAIYTGMIVHKGTVYPGKHLPIIDQEQWDAVQRLLAAHVQGQRSRRTANQSLLVGKIIDGAGDPLIATHANKQAANKQVANNAEAGKLRYRYYVSKAAHFDAAPGGLRIPAREIEGLVTGRIAALFEDPLALIERAKLEVQPAHLPAVIQRGAELALTLKGSRVHDIAALVQQVRVEAAHVEIDVHTAALAELLGTAPPAQSSPPLTLSEPIHLTRTGRVVRLVDGRGKPAVSVAPDPSLTTMLITALRWWAQLAQGQIKVQTLAIQEDVTASWITRVVRLAFLAPPVVEAVLSDQLRADALSSVLLQPGAVPACWQEQQARYLPATP